MRKLSILLAALLVLSVSSYALAQECMAGRQCSGDQLQECIRGAWFTLETCQYGCEPSTASCKTVPIQQAMQPAVIEQPAQPVTSPAGQLYRPGEAQPISIPSDLLTIGIVLVIVLLLGWFYYYGRRKRTRLSSLGRFYIGRSL